MRSLARSRTLAVLGFSFVLSVSSILPARSDPSDFLAPGALAAETLCVQTYNTYGPAYGLWRKDRTRRLLSEIADSSPCEIYQFQEVWVESHWMDLNAGLPLAVRIASGAKDLTGFWADPLRADDVRTGLATWIPAGTLRARPSADRFAWNVQGTLDWIRSWVGAEKGYLVVPTVKAGQPVLLVNTHLHPSSNVIRLAQLIEMTSAIFESPGSGDATIILTGDLNADPLDFEHEFLRGVLGMEEVQRRAFPRSCTYCSSNPLSWLPGEDHVFDYVYVRAGSALTLTLDHAQINFRGPLHDPYSDHYGLRAEFRVESKSPRILSLELARIRADLAIDRAIRILTEKRSEMPKGYYSRIFTKLAGWKSQLSSGTLDSSVFAGLSRVPFELR